MSLQRYRHYLHKIRTNPPHVTLQKAKRKVVDRLSISVDRMRVQWTSPTLSDGEFLGALVPGFPSIERFLVHMATRTSPRFFFSAQARTDIPATLHALCPQCSALILNAADDACAHRFNLLGSGPCQLGEKIDWHTDFKSGHRWNPRQYYRDICPAPYPGGYDLKVPWELSRCQHFAWLGQAYWLTDDQKYAHEFVAQVTDWIAQNPPRLGVNWACAMDVAIRAVNWLWGYYFFSSSPALTSDFQLALFKSLLQHGRHIQKNLEHSEILTSNHYLSDIVGLVYLGILLPEFREAQEWRWFGLQELEKEMFKQVYADGMVFEASVGYHRLSTELFLSATILAELNGHVFGAAYRERLEKMLEFTMQITKPDGTVPLVGDCDNGRLHRLKAWGGADREWYDHRYLLAIGGLLFDRCDFSAAAGDQWEETVWIWGTKNSKLHKEKAACSVPLSRRGTRLFPESGISILRHQDQYVLAIAGPNGQNGNGGHAHNDKLSFEFHAAGQSWFVDPGTYLYTANYQERNLFRSTAYHNTVLVDQQEQNRFLDDLSLVFQLREDAKPRLLRCNVDADAILWVAEHYGYKRFSVPVVHRRTVFLHRQSSVWLLKDQIIGRSAHRCISHFHLAPFLDVEVEENGAIAMQANRHDGQCLQLVPLQTPQKLSSLSNSWVSTGYGARQPAPLLTWEWPEQIDTATWAICIHSREGGREVRIANAQEYFAHVVQDSDQWPNAS